MNSLSKSVLLVFLIFFSASAACASEATAPDQMVAAFFKKLDAGAIEEAYRGLFEGSDLIKEKPQAFQTMVAQTKAAFSILGKISGWEKVDETAYGPSLKRMRYLMSSNAPIAWVFYFWKSQGRWEAVTLRFVDQVELVFN